LTTSKNILFMLTGSIACFKACELISMLSQKGFKVKTVATRSALQFIGPATLEGLTGEPVFSDNFEHSKMMSHIDLARWADMILVCPATANSINSMATGAGGDVITDIFLSNNFQKPFWVAPAMNTQMLMHPATQESIKKLKAWGTVILDTDAGNLACGEQGSGRLLSPSVIFEKIISEFKT
jgi:phosphopantothenoylcysteine synthetase/decarboxylase